MTPTTTAAAAISRRPTCITAARRRSSTCVTAPASWPTPRIRSDSSADHDAQKPCRPPYGSIRRRKHPPGCPRTDDRHPGRLAACGRCPAATAARSVVVAPRRWRGVATVNAEPGCLKDVDTARFRRSDDSQAASAGSTLFVWYGWRRTRRASPRRALAIAVRAAPLEDVRTVRTVGAPAVAAPELVTICPWSVPGLLGLADHLRKHRRVVRRNRQHASLASNASIQCSRCGTVLPCHALPLDVCKGIESDTGYDTRRRVSDGARAGVSQTAQTVLLQGLGSRARIRWVDLVTRPIRTPCGSAASARPRRPSPSIAPVPCGAHA